LAIKLELASKAKRKLGIGSKTNPLLNTKKRHKKNYWDSD
jgi:hypothetical protein